MQKYVVISPLLILLPSFTDLISSGKHPHLRRAAALGMYVLEMYESSSAQDESATPSPRNTHLHKPTHKTKHNY